MFFEVVLMFYLLPKPLQSTRGMDPVSDTIGFFKPRSHSAGMAPVHPGGGQPVYRDEPGHFS